MELGAYVSNEGSVVVIDTEKAGGLAAVVGRLQLVDQVEWADWGCADNGPCCIEPK